MKSLIWTMLILVSFLCIASAQTAPQMAERDGTFFADSLLFWSGGNQVPPFPVSVKSLPTLPVIIPDFLVNNLNGEAGADQTNPAIAIDSSGRYVVTWVDMRSGEKEIYAQFFNAWDQRIGKNIRVSEHPNNWNSAPSVAASAYGGFIIAWAQEHDQILGQRFTSDGIKMGGNFQLNTLSALNTLEPSVAMTDSNYFLATWAQDINGGQGGWNTYARLFDPQRQPLAPEFMVNDVAGAGGTSFGWGRRAAVDGQGRFAVVLSEQSGDYSRIFLQLIDRHGQKIGSNIMVSDSTAPRNHLFPSVAATNDGHFLVIWDNGSGGIEGRVFHPDSGFVTPPLLIYDSPQFGWNPCMASSDRQRRFLINWSGDDPISCRQLWADGQFAGPPVWLRTQSGDSIRGQYSQVSGIRKGYFYDTFMYYHGNDCDALLQKYDLSYHPIGEWQKVRDDSTAPDQLRPMVCFNPQGSALVLWEDQRYGRNDLFAQVFDSSFRPVGENLQINDETGDRWYLAHMKGASFQDGTFVIAFSGGKYYFNQSVYLQKISAMGQKIGPNKLVRQTYNCDCDVAVKTNDRDEVLLCWYNRDNGTRFARVWKFNRELQPISSEIEFLGYIPNLRRQPFALAISDSFDILAAWGNFLPDSGEYSPIISGQFFDEKGVALTNPLALAEMRENTEPYTMDAAVQNRRQYAVAWFDSRGINVVRHYTDQKPATVKNHFVEWYRNAHGPHFVVFQNGKMFVTWTGITNVFGYFIDDTRHQIHGWLLHQFPLPVNYGSNVRNHNSMAFFGSKLLFAYESNRNGTSGYDIWANVQRAEGMDFRPSIIFPRSEEDVLYPNFPNPFRSETTIAFQIPAYHRVKITIYDVLGRQVRVVTDGYREQGVYTVPFDAAGLAAGVYFCRMDAFSTRIIKMLLIR